MPRENGQYRHRHKTWNCSGMVFANPQVRPLIRLFFQLLKLDAPRFARLVLEISRAKYFMSVNKNKIEHNIGCGDTSAFPKKGLHYQALINLRSGTAPPINPINVPAPTTIAICLSDKKLSIFMPKTTRLNMP